MKPELKKLLILNAPYLLFVYLFDKIGQAVRLAPGADLSGKVLSLADGFSAAFATPLPSLAPMDLLNRTHFMVELSPTFMQLASSKDTDRLFSMLPYKTLSFSKIEGRHGTYALIDKNENRGTDIRRVRPSIRAQLAADKRKAAPKKAAVKSKNHELEV